MRNSINQWRAMAVNDAAVVMAAERNNGRRSALLRVESQAQHAEAVQKNQTGLTGSRESWIAVDKTAGHHQPKLCASTHAKHERSVASEARERVCAYGVMNGGPTTFQVALGRRPSLLGVNQPLKFAQRKGRAAPAVPLNQAAR
jgi:hypothetical protein